MPSKLFQFAKKAILPVGAVTASVTAYLIYDDYKSDHRYNKPHETVIPAPTPPPRSRSDILRSMAETAEYDMLVIGGGATGAGVAWDAVTRGYKTALVERDDFASATSSRSTKLVHGGVRYLEKAFWHADYNQYLLVKEALAERRRFIDMAPHLSFPLPIMIPVYKWWQLPYYYVGVKMYDLIAGKANLEPSYLVTRTRALRLFPMLNESELKGAIIYYDGSQNDARMNASLAVTAIEKGADILNYTEVVGLAKDAKGKVCGAEVVDRETNEKFTIRAKSVINATGPFTDAIRKMDDAKTPDIAIGSSGVHIILPGWYCPSNIGLLDAATSDGRVVFFLPWQGSTIAGTTDRPSEIEANPTPTEEDINFVLNEVKHYIDGKLDVKRGDVRAAWSGIRPLVRDPETTDTSNVVRSHSVMVSPSNLVTIAGGKWTTFREMAEETVDKAADVAGLPKLPCRTRDHGEKLVGAEGWDQLRYVDLIRDFGIEPAAARHLSENYGMRAFDVARLCTPTALTPEGTVVQRNARLSPLYPFLDGEILYAMGYEYARTPIDILARRTRLAFLDAEAARDALPDIIEIMARHLGWSLERQGQEFTQSMQWLQAMGLQTYKQAPLSEAITVTPTQHTVEPTDPGNVDPEQLTQAVRALPDMTAQAVSQSLSEQEQLSSLVPLQKEHAHLERPAETAAEKPAEQAQQTQQAPPPAPKNPAAKAAAEKTTH